MKIYALKNETCKNKDLAYIFYYPKTERWYIEIAADADEWDLPFILEHYKRKGLNTVDSFWSREFVRNRIVPSDRQNLGMILKENGLDEYNEFRLFILSGGRCAQDDCYIKEIKPQDIPEEIMERREHYIVSITSDDDIFMITLQNGDIYTLTMETLVRDHDWAKRMLSYLRKISSADRDCSGNCICLDNGYSIPVSYILKHGSKLPVKTSLLKKYACQELISTTEATELLNCSRQNLDELVKRNRIVPAANKGNTRLYFRSDLAE